MSILSKLQNDLDTKNFVVTAELSPPKGVDCTQLLANAKMLNEYVSAFNVTDNQRSVMRMSSLATCKILEDHGYETICQVTCRDRNILAIESDLLGAAALGIKNILALTGDYPIKGDHPFAKPVFDMDSVNLVHLIKQVFADGKDMAGKELDGIPDFFVGVVASQGSMPQEPQLIKLDKKINEGAQFIQTQTVYDTQEFIAFAKKVPHNIPVLAGIFPLKSARAAHFLNDNVPGVKIPEDILKRMDNATDPYKEGVAIAVETLDAIKYSCKGVHFMTMGSVDVIPEILSKVRIDK